MKFDNYMGKFASSGDVQTAVDNGDLVKPYVALVEDGNYIDWNTKSIDYSKMPLTFEITSSGTICWKASNTAYTVTLEYSKNGGEWTEITSNTGTSAPTITVESGDKVKFRANNSRYASSYSYYNTFSGTTCGFNVKGNIMSLLSKDNFSTADTLQKTYTFYYLFQSCTGLTDGSKLILPATTLTDFCYGDMFRLCTSLTSAPVLPATTLATGCYKEMFQSCRSLTAAPVLPATTLVYLCYNYMFNSCRSLTAAPVLPATTLAESCYNQMFYNCSSLTAAPVLPATTLAKSCYSGMFSYCSNLTTAPELPATTLAESCYNGMFEYCSNLNYIKCLVTDISTSYCTSNWVNGVASTGTFVKAAGVNWPTGTSGIPTNWTVQEV